MALVQGRIDGEMERLFREGTLAGIGEDQLLDRFARDRDGVAFAALVERHGPMVLGVCRQLLKDPNDVDDAFQATFLVLVRKAGSLRRRDLLGNWLYGVAYRVARRARSVRFKGQARGTVGRGGEPASLDEQAPDRTEPVADAALRAEERPLIHDEIRRLPGKYQDPVVLCYIEGLTHEEAAAKLGWPVGTVKGRLSRARDLLRTRLARRGVAVSSAAMAGELVTPDLKAAVPASLTQSTLKASLAATSEGLFGLSLASSAATPSVTALTEGVIHAMNVSLIRTIAVPFLVAGALTAGGTVAAYQQGGGRGGFGGAQPAPPPAAKRAATKAVPKASPESEKGAATKSATSPSESTSAVEIARQSVADLEKSAANGDIFGASTYLPWSRYILEYEQREARDRDTRVAAAQRHLDRLTHMLSSMRANRNKTPGITLDSETTKSWWQAIVSAESALREAENFPVEAPKPAVASGPGAGTTPPTAGGTVPGPRAAGPAEGQPANAGGPGGFGGGGGGFGGGGGGAEDGGLGEEGLSRIAITRLAAHIAITDKNPRSVALLKKLDEPISLHFPNETPLEEFLEHIKKAALLSEGKPMPIYLDPVGLQEADKTTTSPVTIDLQDVPLKFGLRLALKQLGLAYCVRDGVLVISSLSGVRQELEEIEAERLGADPNSPRGGLREPGMRGGGGMM